MKSKILILTAVSVMTIISFICSAQASHSNADAAINAVADAEGIHKLFAADEVRQQQTIDFEDLNDSDFIPILVNEVQEEQEKIETQDEKINELEQKIQSLATQQTTSANKDSGATLQQNTPNPFIENTIIRCRIPYNASHAQLLLYTNTGKLLKTFSLKNKGMIEVNFSAGHLAAGQYVYALIVDGKKVDSKTMMITK